MTENSATSLPHSRTTHSPQRSLPTKLAAVLLLVVGLLGMHGLASSHAGMPDMISARPAATQTMSGAQPASQPSTTPGTGHTSAVTTVGTATADLMNAMDTSAARLLDGPPGGHDIAGLCLAILSAAALTALALGIKRVLASHSGSSFRALSGTARSGVSRPPPDLRRLCISRT